MSMDMDSFSWRLMVRIRDGVNSIVTGEKGRGGDYHILHDAENAMCTIQS